VLFRSDSQLAGRDFIIKDATMKCVFNVSSMIANAKLQQCSSVMTDTSVTAAVVNIAYLQELGRIQASIADCNPMTHRIFVAQCLNGSIIGYIDIDRTGYNPIQFPVPYISDVIVAPIYRRQGVARALLQRCEDLCAQEWQETELHLWVETENAAALALYRALGYSPIRGETGDANDLSTLRVQVVSLPRSLDPELQSDFWDELVTQFDRILMKKQLKRQAMCRGNVNRAYIL